MFLATFLQSFRVLGADKCISSILPVGEEVYRWHGHCLGTTQQGRKGKFRRYSPIRYGLGDHRSITQRYSRKPQVFLEHCQSRANWMKYTSAHLMSNCRLGTDAFEPKGNLQPPIQFAPEGEWEVVLKIARVCNICYTIERG